MIFSNRPPRATGLADPAQTDHAADVRIAEPDPALRLHRRGAENTKGRDQQSCTLHDLHREFLRQECDRTTPHRGAPADGPGDPAVRPAARHYTAQLGGAMSAPESH